MKKVLLALLIGAAPAGAQPRIGVDVNVNVGDNYDSAPPGDPVESVDVFYDQLEPYGVWVDEPDAGRVFIPEQTNFVPYQTGHWQYTSVGFVWVSSEPFAWATTHYGRWAYSNAYARWYWLPDTEWGPAWVSWRQTGTDFGWAPLPPAGISWQPPVESWHYCPSDRVLDVNVTRYYEPRERVITIHREAQPIRNEVTMGRTRVVVGPGAAQLRERHITVRPVKAEARVVGRWTAGEAHAQVVRAQERHVEVEKRNQTRIEGNAHFHAAQVKVIETHPEIRTRIDARVQGKVEVQPGHGPVVHQPEPERGHGPVEHGPAQPAHPERAPEPTRVQPAPTPAQPTHGVPGHEHGSPTPQPQPERGHGPVVHQPEPAHPAEPARAPEPTRVQPAPQPAQPPATHRPPESGHGPVIHQPEPAHPAQPAPQPRAPEPVHAQPAPQPAQPRPAPAQPAPQPKQAQPAQPHPTEAPAHSGEREHGEHEKK